MNSAVLLLSGGAIVAIGVAILWPRRLGNGAAVPRHALQLAKTDRWRRFAPFLHAHSAPDPETVDRRLALLERRHGELLADPRRRHHAAAVLTGEYLSDAELDYRDDPADLRTCEHLRDAERRLKASGLPCAVRDEEPAEVCVAARAPAGMLDDLAARPTIFLHDNCERRSIHDECGPTARCRACGASIAFQVVAAASILRLG